MMDRRAVLKFNLLSAHSEVFPPRQASLLPMQLLKPFAMYQVEIAATAVLTASHCTHKKQKLFFYPIAFNPQLYVYYLTLRISHSVSFLIFQGTYQFLKGCLLELILRGRLIMLCQMYNQDTDVHLIHQIYFQ